MLASTLARDDVVDGQVGRFAPAILAGETITPEDFVLGQLDAWARAVNHVR